MPYHDTNPPHYHTRKALEIAFRRWLSGSFPCRAFTQYLREKDPAVYRATLSAQFSKGMDFQTYGQTWQADHIVPLSLFDLRSHAQIALAWSLDNLRPLTPQGNKARGASVADSFCALLSRPAIDGSEKEQLIAMVAGRFAESYPGLSVRVADRAIVKP